MQQPMPMRILLAASLACVLLAPDARAQHRPPPPPTRGMGGAGGAGALPSIGRPMHDQDEAFAARRSGQVMPLHQIEGRIVPRMPGCDYLGPEFDAGSGVYRLKFMRGGSLVYVDVDGRTGQVVGRSGN
jgi:hypothetical protein